MVEIIETFVNYMENLERCICIVYDLTASYTGALGLKAIRLSDTFVEAYREGARAGGGRAGGGESSRDRDSCWAGVLHAFLGCMLDMSGCSPGPWQGRAANLCAGASQARCGVPYQVPEAWAPLFFGCTSVTIIM